MSKDEDRRCTQVAELFRPFLEEIGDCYNRKVGTSKKSPPFRITKRVSELYRKTKNKVVPFHKRGNTG